VLGVLGPGLSAWLQMTPLRDRDVFAGRRTILLLFTYPLMTAVQIVSVRKDAPPAAASRAGVQIPCRRDESLYRFVKD
jgi:hypothetical protein